MTAAARCNDCNGVLRFTTHRITGATVELCDGCGYHGPMRLCVPKPVTFTAAELELDGPQDQTRTCVCRQCGRDFQARRVKPRAECSPDCQRAWLRTHRPKKPTRQPGPSKCPKCGTRRFRGQPRPSHPHGAWRCTPCEKRAFEARRERQRRVMV